MNEISNSSSEFEKPKRFEIQAVEFEVELYTLVGTIYKAEGRKNPGVLILSGGANIPHNEGYYPDWQKSMAQAGIDSLAFDYRGVGRSEGELTAASLNARLEDASAAKNIFFPEKLYIAGVSMGANAAIRLANEVVADGLILISPAAYSAEARNKLYGQAFTQAISKPESWRDSPEFSELEEYPGKVLVVYGEQDDVVPMPILHRYARIGATAGTVLAFNETGHRFMREDDPASIEARNRLHQAIRKLVS